MGFSTLLTAAAGGLGLVKYAPRSSVPAKRLSSSENDAGPLSRYALKRSSGGVASVLENEDEVDAGEGAVNELRKEKSSNADEVGGRPNADEGEKRGWDAAKLYE